MKFKVGEKVLLAKDNGYIMLGPQGIVLEIDERNATYPYKVMVVQPDGTVDALVFAEDELEAI